MATAAVVLRQSLPGFDVVNHFYAAAPHEPTADRLMPVDRVDAFGVTFHALLDAIIARKRAYVVVVGHGAPEIGLTMQMAAATDVSAGSAMESLLKVVQSLDDSGENPDDEAVRAAGNDAALPAATIIKMAKKCWKISNTPGMAVEVHIRGCGIGKDLKHLRRIQRIFNSTVVSAPNCPMLYTTVHPLTKGTVSDVEAWGSKNPPIGRRWIYPADSDKGPILLDLEYLGEKARSQSVVQARGDVHKWAQDFHQNASTPSWSDFPIAALYPDKDNDYFLPHEPGYLARIASVSSV